MDAIPSHLDIIKLSGSLRSEALRQRNEESEKVLALEIEPHDSLFERNSVFSLDQKKPI